MNKRLTERERLLFKLDHLSEAEIIEVLDYVNLMESARQPMSSAAQSRLFPDPGDDELIALLSGAYENRRARQVMEWEATRRRADSLATARHFARP